MHQLLNVSRKLMKQQQMILLLDLVIPMYNLIENSSTYSETIGSLWFYPKYEATNFNNKIKNNDNFNSFKYKA